MSVCNLSHRAQAVCAAALAVLVLSSTAARPMHQCDALGAAAWKTVPTVETVAEAESAPYQIGATGDWFVDRTTTLLPMCNYYNAVGNYSLRSYSLKPEQQTERIRICRSDPGGVSIAIPPYRGPCPAR
jgi:hypothetical protein